MAFALPISRRARDLASLRDAERDARPTDAAVPERVRAAAIEALERGETHYTDRPGILPLRTLVAERLRAMHGIDVAAGSVVITCGVTEARFVAVQCLLEPGGVLLCGDDAPVRGAARVRDVTVTHDPTDERAAAVYVAADSPSRARLLEVARDRGIPTIYETNDGDADHPAAQGLAEVVTIGAIGDAAGLHGWRVGFLAAPPASLVPLRDFKQALTICTTNLSQWAACALLEEE